MESQEIAGYGLGSSRSFSLKEPQEFGQRILGIGGIEHLNVAPWNSENVPHFPSKEQVRFEQESRFIPQN